MLLGVESDLCDEEFEKKAMVYCAYGRGRVMPPYIGEGITGDNLLDCVAFLAGACSCMVKEQNPGVDLLMAYDWESAAETMAENDETLDPWGYDEFPVEEPVEEPEDEAEMAAEADPEEGVEETPDDEPAGEQPAADAVALAPIEEPAEEPMVEEPAVEEPVVEEPAAEEPVEEPSEKPEALTAEEPAGSPATTTSTPSFAARQTWTMALGLAAAAVIVAVVGLMIVMRRGAG